MKPHHSLLADLVSPGSAGGVLWGLHYDRASCAYTCGNKRADP